MKHNDCRTHEASEEGGRTEVKRYGVEEVMQAMTKHRLT